MLLSFSVENYRSFKEEQTLNLIASKKLGTDSPTQCVRLPDVEESALRVSSLYGANGAGKSNLVSALRFIEGLVLNGTGPGKRIARTPFALDEGMSAQPSCFEIRYLSENEVFRYGFACDAERIHEEWLDAYEGKRERNVFTRTTGEQGTAKVELGPAGKDVSGTKLAALAEVGARSNQLFLTEVVNLDDSSAQGARLARAIKWFSTTLHIIPADATFLMLTEMMADEKFAEFAGRFLKEASTGISSLAIQTREIPISEFSSLPSEIVKQMFPKIEEGESAFLAGPDGYSFFIEGAKKDVVKVRRVSALHPKSGGGHVPLPLEEESDGSRRLLNLLPALYHLHTESGVYVIDELERSMHPMLARKFIEYFLNAVKTPSRQLLFTTHESTLLDLDLLRRDGIWFAEKDAEGGSHLYSLSDFKVRKDLRIDKGYLQGRFGAIPFLGGIDHLIEEAAQGEVQE